MTLVGIKWPMTAPPHTHSVNTGLALTAGANRHADLKQQAGRLPAEDRVPADRQGTSRQTGYQQIDRYKQMEWRDM